MDDVWKLVNRWARSPWLRLAFPSEMGGHTLNSKKLGIPRERHYAVSVACRERACDAIPHQRKCLKDQHTTKIVLGGLHRTEVGVRQG